MHDTDRHLTVGSFTGSANKVFHHSNRMGVSGTLHRVCAITDSYGLRGLTYRIGRHISGRIHLAMPHVFKPT